MCAGVAHHLITGRVDFDMPSTTPRPINVLLIGGCGHWAATENHVPAILTLQRSGFPVRVSAICDLRDPYDENLLRHMPDLLDLLCYDRPQWIQPRPGEKAEDLERRLDDAHAHSTFDVAIVACDPVAHYPYLHWATLRGIHVLCDKPILAVADAAWDVHAAATIDTHFDTLLKAHLNNPGHLFALPMRRRANDAFVESSRLITEVYENHGQPLTMANFTVTGGHFRLPEEYAFGNAHGYTHGVGALAFSSYHYIDLMAWYLRQAQGPVTALRITSHYVRRVGDYLATGQNRALEALLRPLSPGKPQPSAWTGAPLWLRWTSPSPSNSSTTPPGSTATSPTPSPPTATPTAKSASKRPTAPDTCPSGRRAACPNSSSTSTRARSSTCASPRTTWLVTTTASGSNTAATP